jgi:hypothetical protein
MQSFDFFEKQSGFPSVKHNNIKLALSVFVFSEQSVNKDSNMLLAVVFLFFVT